MGSPLTGEAAFPIFIIIIVLAMILWAMSFTRLAPGFRTVLDTRNGINVPWVQTGWLAFAWAFLFVSLWPVIDEAVARLCAGLSGPFISQLTTLENRIAAEALGASFRSVQADLEAQR